MGVIPTLKQKNFAKIKFLLGDFARPSEGWGWGMAHAHSS
jgi:hypothetical protein